MYRGVSTATTTRGGSPTDSGDSVVTLDQVPRWSDVESRPTYGYDNGDPSFANPFFPDPLASSLDGDNNGNGVVSRFPVDHEINSKIHLWRGNPWNLEVDAVVNSTNENLDEAHSSTGLHAAAGPGLAEECATLGGCRTGMAKVTNAYDLPARRVIHTVGPKYAVKYHTAAENALSHCYRACLELLIDNELESIAMGCIYTEAKNYPREPAAHVAIRTVRRFLEKQRDKITAVVFCTTTSTDTEIYKRLLPLYFPRDKHEEEVAISKLPADVGDENGETTIDERKIRIKPLPKKNIPKPPETPEDLPVNDVSLVRRDSTYLDSYLDPAFMSLIKDPDQRRREQWEKTAQAQSGFNFAKLLGFGDLGGPPLSAAEEYSLHSRYLAKANSLNLSEIAEMKIVYRGGVDSEGRPVMVVVGAHFLLRCLDLERFVLHVIKEFEPLIQKPFSIVYFHSAASLQLQPDLGFMRKLQQILGRKHQRNLHAIYVLHPTLHLKAVVLAMQMLVHNVTWKKVVYVDRLLQLFKYVPREQLTIPDFVFHYSRLIGQKYAPRPRSFTGHSNNVRLLSGFGVDLASKCNPNNVTGRRSLRVEAGWLFSSNSGNQDSNSGAKLEQSESTNEDILIFFFQLDLATRVQCALNMEQYDVAQQLRNKLAEVEQDIVKRRDTTRGASSKSEAQDKAINMIRLRADLQNAIEKEDYALAAEFRDQISKLEKESLAVSAEALAYANVQYAFRLGQKVRHKIFGYRAVICGMDPVCCESSSWMESAKIQKLDRGPNQPFYQVLVDITEDPNLLVTYGSKLVIQARFDHPYASFLFYGVDTAGDFIPVKQLREKFDRPRHEVPIDPPDENNGGSP
ncbi:Clp protease adapter protein ClpF, chloroplastic [Linum grandiflorum]